LEILLEANSFQSRHRRTARLNQQHSKKEPELQQQENPPLLFLPSRLMTRLKTIRLKQNFQGRLALAKNQEYNQTT